MKGALPSCLCPVPRTCPSLLEVALPHASSLFHPTTVITLSPALPEYWPSWPCAAITSSPGPSLLGLLPKCPFRGRRWRVLTREASLSEALSVQISHSLPDSPRTALGARLTGLQLPALFHLPRAHGRLVWTPGHCPTSKQQDSVPAPARALLRVPNF